MVCCVINKVLESHMDVSVYYFIMYANIMPVHFKFKDHKS